jgi:hypothetical protein
MLYAISIRVLSYFCLETLINTACKLKAPDPDKSLRICAASQPRQPHFIPSMRAFVAAAPYDRHQMFKLAP